jgi:hypothetical protein
MRMRILYRQWWTQQTLPGSQPLPQGRNSKSKYEDKNTVPPVVDTTDPARKPGTTRDNIWIEDENTAMPVTVKDIKTSF